MRLIHDHEQMKKKGLCVTYLVGVGGNESPEIECVGVHIPVLCVERIHIVLSSQFIKELPAGRFVLPVVSCALCKAFVNASINVEHMLRMITGE